VYPPGPHRAAAQGPVIPSTEASARHVTQTARDSLNNVTPNLRVTRPKGATGSKFYLSGPRSATKRSLQVGINTIVTLETQLLNTIGDLV